MKLLAVLVCSVLAILPHRAIGAVVAVVLPTPEAIRSDFFPEYYPKDVDGDGTIDFTFGADSTGAAVRTERANRVAILVDLPPNRAGALVAFDLGAFIGINVTLPIAFYSSDFAGDHYVSEGEFLWTDIIQCYDTCSITTFAGRRAYAGFEFESNGTKHYGYFDLYMAHQSRDITLYGWAYESEGEKPIIAGQIPEPSTSALIGGSTFLLWQRNATNRKENKALQRTPRGWLVSTLSLIRKCLGFGGDQPRP
jgi:hypothetical protein